jgi:Holliday junction resolvase RusA-like endonuclease
MTDRLAISFFVLGEPEPQPRPNARAMILKRDGQIVFDPKTRWPRYIAQIYNPASADAWKARVAHIARLHAPPAPLTGPVEVRLTFILPHLRKHFRTGRFADQLREDAPAWACDPSTGDGDNLEKPVWDAMKGLMWDDDTQIVKWGGCKFYGPQPGCLVELEPLGYSARQAGAQPPIAQQELFTS